MLTEKTFDVIGLRDEAIDTDAMTPGEGRAYERERDVSTLKFKQGMKPTRFRMRRLLKTEKVMYERIHNESDKCLFAFKCGFVEAFDAWDSRGRIDRHTPTDPKSGLTESEMFSEDGPFDIVDMQDVGMVVAARSFLARGSKPRYVLPPLLREHWEARPFLSAAQSVAQRSSSKDNETAASTGHTEASSGAPSASPTDVHATAETSRPVG
jgi:hypothetical protein